VLDPLPGCRVSAIAVRSLLTALLALAPVAYSAGVTLAGNTEHLIPRDQHPWGQFAKGSWKRVRATTETFDEQGRVSGVTVTETKTTLLDMTEMGVTLQVDVAVEVGGKRFASAPQLIKQTFGGESEGQPALVRKVGDGVVTIDGQKIPAEVRQIVYQGNGSRRTRTIHYSAEVSPNILREECIGGDAEGKTTSYQTDVEVVALDMPLRYNNQLLSASLRKVTHRTTGGAVTTTLEQYSPEVPGGVVGNTLKEINADGKMTRRSTLELVDFQVVEQTSDARAARPRLFSRLRERK